MIDSSSNAAPTIFDLVAEHPADTIAIVCPDTGVDLTYGVLRSQTKVLAGALAKAGLGRGDRIAIAAVSVWQQLVSILAASSIGVAVPIPDAGEERALELALGKCGAAGLIGPSLDTVRVLRRKSDADRPPRAIDAAVILSTRGRTGPPRPVLLTHGNLLAAARLVAASLELRPDDVSLNVMPLSHVHGLVSVALATLASGGTLVLPQAFHPLAFWRIARDHGVTWYSAAPSVHQWLLARTADPGARKPAGAARLRFIRSAGATLPPAVRRTLESAFGAPVIDAYEVTEAAGEALAGHVTILDTSGVPVPAGVRGEIAVSGPTVAAGYDNAPDLTHKFFVGGRFHTGDLGYRDPHGRLTLVTEGE